MVKKIKKILFTLIFLSLAWLCYVYTTRPTLIAPLPYKISADYGNEVDLAEAAHVLIIGDHLGKSLERYTSELIRKLSVNLKDELRVVNWARENESIGRTLHKLKSLNKFPPFILYLGAGQEFVEKKFRTKDYKTILSNIEKFNDEDTASLIYAFPPISKFIYDPVKLISLNKDISVDPGELTSKNEHKKMEIFFKLFDVELEELIGLTKEKGSYLVLSTTPINIQLPPKKVCINSTTQDLENYQNDLQKKISAGSGKTLVSEIRKLSEATLTNARTFYLLGEATYKAGLFQESREAFSKAAAFDCGSWRAHPVFNAIIRKKAAHQGVKLIDFENIVNRHLGKNELFLSDHFPQEIYYNHYIDELYDTIKNRFRL